MSAEESWTHHAPHRSVHRHFIPRSSFGDPPPFFPVSSPFLSPLPDSNPLKKNNKTNKEYSIFSAFFHLLRDHKHDNGEAKEPTSPKVSCIGRVNAMTKNKKKKKIQQMTKGSWREAFIFGNGTDALSPTLPPSSSSLRQKGAGRHGRSMPTRKDDGEEETSSYRKDLQRADPPSTMGMETRPSVNDEMLLFSRRSSYEDLPPLHCQASRKGRNTNLLISDDIFPETWLRRIQETPDAESKLVSIVPEMGNEKDGSHENPWYEESFGSGQPNNRRKKITFLDESVDTDCMRCSKTRSIHERENVRWHDILEGRMGKGRRGEVVLGIREKQRFPLTVAKSGSGSGVALAEVLQGRLCSGYC